MVSTLWKWFWCRKQRAFWMAKNIWRRRIAGTDGWKPMSNAKTTCRSIKLCSISYFQLFERSTRKENESHMNWNQETLKGEKPSANFCLLANKERSFCTELWLAMKSGSFDSPKTICDPGQPSTPTPKRNIHEKKAMLCIWWDQKDVVYQELLKSGETNKNK